MADAVNPLEDWRGVDVGQIRNQLRKTVAERVAEMVHFCNLVLEVQRTASESKSESRR
ncbi:MAG: hypothetical protein RLZ37_1091 [Actinomycetota bacterium]|jgi:hypothetical protein